MWSSKSSQVFPVEDSKCGEFDMKTILHSEPCKERGHVVKNEEGL